MTDPSVVDDPILRWGLIFHGSGHYTPSHTRPEWACLADAIRAADQSLPDAAAAAAPSVGARRIRGDAPWCQVAADTYTRLNDANAYQHPTLAEAPHCFADEALIRAWLDAPWVPPGPTPQTMAEAAGWDIGFEPDRLPDPAALKILVDVAQDAGVFGVEQHRVGLWRWFGDGTVAPHTFLLTVQPPAGPGLASPLLGAPHLLRGGQKPVDAIVEVLQRVAAVANQLLGAPTGPDPPAQHPTVRPDNVPAVPPGVDGRPVGHPGRAFPPLRLVQPTPPDPAARPPAPPGPSGRHR